MKVLLFFVSVVVSVSIWSSMPASLALLAEDATAEVRGGVSNCYVNGMANCPIVAITTCRQTFCFSDSCDPSIVQNLQETGMYNSAQLTSLGSGRTGITQQAKIFCTASNVCSAPCVFDVQMGETVCAPDAGTTYSVDRIPTVVDGTSPTCP